MKLIYLEVLDLVLPSLACSSREGLLPVCLTGIPSDGDGAAEKQTLMIIRFNKLNWSGFPGRRKRS